MGYFKKKKKTVIQQTARLGVRVNVQVQRDLEPGFLISPYVEFLGCEME